MPDDAGPATNDAGPEACGVDVACPSELPRDGTPCAGNLECLYEDFEGGGCADPVSCEDGQWRWPGCLPSNPFLGEYCDDPSSAAGHTAELEIEPEIMWGTQGFSMIAYHLALDPFESAPACIEAQQTIEVDGMTVVSNVDLAVRCGAIDSALVIMPQPACDARDYEITLTLEIEGLDPIVRTITAPGGGPMGGPSPCGI